MEIKPPGISWWADLPLAIERWFHILDQYFAMHFGFYTAATISLAALTCAVIVYYMLHRPRFGRKLAVTFAVTVGFATVIQLLLAVKTSEMAEDYGRGYSTTCQVFERDENGHLVFDPHPVVVEGEKKIAMIARKVLYMVDSSPVTGHEDQQLKLGFLLVSASKAGDFPTYCGLPLNEEAKEILENINLQRTPVNTDQIYDALLMEQDGFQAYMMASVYAYRSIDDLDPGTKMFLRHLATQLSPEDLLPLTTEGLIRAMKEAAKNSRGMAMRMPRWLGAELERELARAGMSAEDAERVRKEWFKSMGMSGYYSFIIQHVVENNVGDALTSQTALFALTNYGLSRSALLDIMQKAIRKINLRYSGLYAAEVTKVIENLKLHERRPLIHLPGEPLWYIIDPGEGEGEGQEGDEGEEGEGQSAEDAAEGAYQRGLEGRIAGERFGDNAGAPNNGAGAKNDEDRS